jgi:hypothetical protein
MEMLSGCAPIFRLHSPVGDALAPFYFDEAEIGSTDASITARSLVVFA